MYRVIPVEGPFSLEWSRSPHRPNELSGHDGKLQVRTRIVVGRKGLSATTTGVGKIVTKNIANVG